MVARCLARVLGERSFSRAVRLKVVRSVFSFSSLDLLGRFHDSIASVTLFFDTAMVSPCIVWREECGRQRADLF